MGGGRGEKKARNVGLPLLQAPPFGPPPFGRRPSGPPLFLGLGPYVPHFYHVAHFFCAFLIVSISRHFDFFFFLKISLFLFLLVFFFLKKRTFLFFLHFSFCSSWGGGGWANPNPKLVSSLGRRLLPPKLVSSLGRGGVTPSPPPNLKLVWGLGGR